MAADKSADKKKRNRIAKTAVGGSSYKNAVGLKPINLLVPEKEREQIRVAAAFSGESMAAFSRRVVVAEAIRVMEEKGLDPEVTE